MVSNKIALLLFVVIASATQAQQGIVAATNVDVMVLQRISDTRETEPSCDKVGKWANVTNAEAKTTSEMCLLGPNWKVRYNTQSMYTATVTIHRTTVFIC